MKEHVVTPFCREVRKLEEDFKNCRKLLTAVGDENHQHLLCVMLNCPVEGARVMEITEIQCGNKTRNHGQYTNPNVKI